MSNAKIQFLSEIVILLSKPTLYQGPWEKIWIANTFSFLFLCSSYILYRVIVKMGAILIRAMSKKQTVFENEYRIPNK